MWAEFLGMTLFVFVGIAAAVNTPLTSNLDVLKVSFAFGFGIFVLACTIGHHSGGQMNCAVTFCLVLTGDVSIVQGLCNTLAQILGALLGSFLLWAVFPTGRDKTGTLGCNMLSPGYEWINAMVGEIFMTFLLCFVVLETAVHKNKTGFNKRAGTKYTAELAIGMAVFLAHTSLIAVDGCSINPTRSFGPAVVASLRYEAENSTNQPLNHPKHIWHDHYIFWVGPLLGAALAAGMARFWWHPGQWTEELEVFDADAAPAPAAGEEANPAQM